MAPGDLDKALCGFKLPTDPNLLVGLDSADDAGVYKISDELALIQTVDFFTPIVDDPYWFGQIAAANAMSDVYAMGGVPKTAMNLVGFPSGEMDLSILRRIIEGGIDKMQEAGVVLVGGHTVQDPELKYGLSVTGFVHPERILVKRNLHPGDRLILTKPLGTGIIATAIKGGLASPESEERITRAMAALNRDAAETMKRFPVHACTDITGFGLLGHLAEMVSGSGRGVRVDSAGVPLFPDALEYATMGLIPAGAYRNREYRESMIEFARSVDQALQDILFDPQTSGGLLISVAGSKAEELLEALVGGGVRDAAIVGEVVDEPKERIVVF
jgi:selenide, water dikinase